MAQKTLLVLISLFIFSSCSSVPVNKRIYISDTDYQAIALANTSSGQSYDGLVNTIDLRATLLTLKLKDAQSMKKATNMQWTDAELQADREYNEKSALSETKIFLSFFTPDSKEDNLHKADTVWRIFLDVEGKRYVGTIQKMSDTPSEISDLYPEHTKFGTAYISKFMVPTATVESNKAKLTLTGPVGSVAVEFKKQNP